MIQQDFPRRFRAAENSVFLRMLEAEMISRKKMIERRSGSLPRRMTLVV